MNYSTFLTITIALHCCLIISDSKMSPKYHELGGTIVGPVAEQLYRDLEKIDFDFNAMISEKVGQSVLKVAQSMSCPAVYISNSPSPACFRTVSDIASLSSCSTSRLTVSLEPLLIDFTK